MAVYRSGHNGVDLKSIVTKVPWVRILVLPPLSQTDTESGDSVRITPAAVKRCIGRGDLCSRSAKVRGAPLIEAYHAADDLVIATLQKGH